MKLWMDVQRDLEVVMNDYPRIFDGWGEGGVGGVVFGPPVFNTGKLLRGCKPRPPDSSSDAPVAALCPPLWAVCVALTSRWRSNHSLCMLNGTGVSTVRLSGVTPARASLARVLSFASVTFSSTAPRLASSSPPSVTDRSSS